MLKPKCLLHCLGWLTTILIAGTCPVFGADGKSLPGHIPPALSGLTAKARLAATNELALAIGLPVRNQSALAEFLRQLYEPGNPNFHQYLTPAEFTARFGPTEQDYAVVRQFAETNGFTVIGTHRNRLVLEVRARAATVEKSFHVTLQTYRHPRENRDFFAPDADPVVAASVPIQHISGLDNFALRRPLSLIRPLTATAAQALPQSGSGTNGSYRGNDFRAAYVPGTTLTGSGQSVALLQFDGYYSNDIAAYISQAGLTNYAISLTNVAVNGGVTTPGTGNGEVCLDIEMVLAMAPGVAKILVYEAPNGSTAWATILSQIANDNLARQISCSWGDTSVGTPDPTSEAIFQQMAAQGQSFFNASGDSDAFVGGIPFPSESTNITQVGGTTLSTTGAGGAWAAETTWNWGGGTGSSGGVSTHYGLPSWQQGISMTSNLGSSALRNVPDVALTGDNVSVIYHLNGITTNRVFGGTSCAAPLWAAFMALVNQQAASLGNSPAGFINPVIYSLGKGSNANYSYNSCFHDITTGNNYWSSSLTNYPAVPGFDLCTGWGTPTVALISALAGATDALVISPAAGYVISGAVGGPFNLTSANLLLTNSGASPLTWSLINTSAWLQVSAPNGLLAANSFSNLTVRLTTAASNLAAGTYSANLRFTNQTSQVGQSVPFSLQIMDALVVAPAVGFTATGGYGGPFSVTSQSYALTNLSGVALNWSLSNPVAWLSVSASSGTLVAGDHTAVTVNLTSAANLLPLGTNLATVTFSNRTSGVSLARQFGVLVQPVQLVTNGGFETGSFTGWTLANNTVNTRASTYNKVASATTTGVVHTGNYGAALGDTQLMKLSQTLATTPGQNYLLSLWLANSTSGSGQQFVVNWNTNAASANPIYSWSGSTSFGWTNLLFVVSASSPNTVLQFQAMNLPYFFGLDDVSVTAIPAPTFTGFSKSANRLNLAWNSLVGVAYQVQYKTNLLQANWLVLTNFTATANVTSLTNLIGPDPGRFYRVRSGP